MEIKNLKKAASRILKAIRNKEKIILYGDADLDGVTSVIILKETLKNLGENSPVIYFPDREKEGYGITENALNFLKKESPALFIVSDCGIGNFEEVALARKLGFETIIIDHHEILDRLPGASIIVDPKQKGDKYPFKELANVGIAYKLSQLLLKDKPSDSLKRSFLELVALATLADMMPEVNDNKIMIEDGLSFLENSWRPGIQTFLKIRFTEDYLNLRQKVFKIISLLNVRDVENRLPASFRLLTTSSPEEAKKMIDILLEKSLIRKQKIQEITAEVEEKILAEKETLIIFTGAASWELILLGPVASLICSRHKKPTFLFKKEKTESQGAVRLPRGLNGVKAMLSCRQLLKTYGGHPLAAGFRVKNENLEKFKKCLIEYFSR